MANKKLGQHWLKDQAVLHDMVVVAEIDAGDNVLEVGPGQAALTDKLAAAGASVTAVELDEVLANKLSGSFAGSERIEVVHGDILDFDLSQLPKDYKVAANIPYYLTAALIKKLTTSANPPKLMALLVQAEVAERLAAKPGSLSVIGVAAQLFGNVEIIKEVPASAFEPAPKVNSAIVKIARHEEVDAADNERLMKLVRHGFANKRKTLANSLSAGLKLAKPSVEKYVLECGLKPSVRAQELTLEDWRKLHEVIERNNDTS